MASLTYLTKTDIVAKALRKEILGGALHANSKLRQEDVAERLGVSPTPVREAFGILEKEGFLRRRAHRGVIVVERTIQEIETAYELRIAVESVAVRRLAATAEPATIATLSELVKRSGAALARRDPMAFRQTTSGFHVAIARAVGSDTIAEVVDALVARSLFYGPTPTSLMRQQQAEHARIVNLIQLRQPGTAVEALTAHMKATVRELRRLAATPRQDAVGATRLSQQVKTAG